MTPIRDMESAIVFVGTMDDDGDLYAASAIATACEGFARDDDDECYIDGDEPTCFNCQGRRWTPVGFTCMRGLLRT